MRLNDATPDMWDKATQKYGKVAEKTGIEPWATMAEAEAVEDLVNNPDHYNTGNIECI